MDDHPAERSSQPLPVLAIGGPTASGKTDLGIELARTFDGEILNADSRQVYRGMDIGTAKPTAAQRAGVPHHLLDLVDPTQSFTLADYTRHAHQEIARIATAGHLPVLVGGTGLYLRAVLQGYSVPAVAPDTALRERLEQTAREEGQAALVAQLRAVDPVSADRIDPRNVRRVIRALEVTLTLGVPFSSLQHKTAPYRALLIVLHGERTDLYERADRRLDAMLATGFADEVRALLDAGCSTDLPSMSALGYREIAAALTGETSMREAEEATRLHTHDFIRRQLTWFRSEKQSALVPIGETATAGGAHALVSAWLQHERPAPADGAGGA